MQKVIFYLAVMLSACIVSTKQFKTTDKVQ